MGVFKINGTNILTIAEVISDTDVRQKSAAFSSGKLNVTGLSDVNKTLANAPSGYFWTENIVGNKLKVNGVADTVSRVGCRPQLNNFAGGMIVDGYTVTLQKKTDGSIYAQASLSSASQTVVPASINAKYLYILIQSAGGAGGQGVASNKGGGSGGGSGAACIFCVKIDHTGDFLEMNISGYTTGAGGQSTVYYIDSSGTKTQIATLNGGSKGADGYNPRGGAGGSGTWNNTHANIYRIDMLNGVSGGHGKQYNGVNATAGSNSSYTKTYGVSGEKNTLTVNVSGGAASGTDPGGGGGAGRLPYFLSSGKGGDGGAAGNSGYNGLNGAGGGGGANKGIFQSNVSGGRGGAGCFNIMY